MDTFMKTIFIEALNTESGTIEDYFQISGVERKNTTQGKAYLNIGLRDRTGTLKGKLWDIPDDLPELRIGSCVKVRALIETYRDELQAKVLKLRLLTDEEKNLDDYLPASKRDRDQMLAELDDLLAGVSDAHPGLRDLLLVTVHDPVMRAQLRNAPAAKSNHQPYLGGLLEHILNLAALAQGVCITYPALDADLLIAAAFLHDIGKCWELHYSESIGYTRAGSLIGHVVMGAQFVADKCGELDTATTEHLMHLIVSHHGNREWGAPVVPMTREAQVFHLLDMIDSRLGAIENTLATGVDDEGMTPWNRALETALWNGR